MTRQLAAQPGPEPRDGNVIDPRDVRAAMRILPAHPSLGRPCSGRAANLLGVLLIACSAGGSSGAGSGGPGPSAGSPQGIAGVEWRAISIGGRAPVADHVPTIKFEADRATGSAGCNSYGATVSISGTTIAVHELMQTQMACADPNAMEIEGRFTAALAAATQVGIRDGHLVVSGPQGELVFERAP